MESFDDLVMRMRRIFRGEESYGTGTPAEQAHRFRFDRMFDEIVRRARENSEARCQSEQRGPLPEVDVLISLSGFSPITTILAYEVLRPRKVLLITSEKAGHNVNTIGQYLVKPGRLDFAGFRHFVCDPVNPLGIYHIICREVEGIRKPDAAHPRAIIDITGGKKVMSATAALAASQLELPMCYVDGDYDNELRQPVPGSETLIILPNPTSVFCEQEMETAAAIFRNGAYGSAWRRYDELSNRLSEPTLARFLRDLSALYREWCNLDLEHLPQLISSAENGLNDPRVKINQQVADRLRQQFEFLRRLASKDPLALLLGFYVLGLHYSELERHDFAAMLFYRTIEGCFRERLYREYQFDCGNPDYSKIYSRIGVDENELLAKYSALADTLRRPADVRLPPRVGLINAAGLLFVAEDQLLKKADIATPKAMGHLLHVSDVRNQSVLAHGYRSITPEESRQLQQKALHILRAFWQIHVPKEDLDQQCETLRFVRGIDQ